MIAELARRVEALEAEAVRHRAERDRWLQVVNRLECRLELAEARIVARGARMA